MVKRNTVGKRTQKGPGKNNPKSTFAKFLDTYAGREKSSQGEAFLAQPDLSWSEREQSDRLARPLKNRYRDPTFKKFEERILKKIVESLEIRPTDSIVSVGSGIGFIETFIARNYAKEGRVLAIDFSTGMNREAQKVKRKSRTGNLKVLEASGENLPVRSATQDKIIVDSQVLGNIGKNFILPKARKVFEECHRVLKKDPNSRLIFGLVIPDLALNHMHLTVIEPFSDTQKKLMEKLGFKVLKVVEVSSNMGSSGGFSLVVARPI